MAKTSTSRNQRVTSSDIARFVGVSQATVSRAFSHDSSITDLTRAKILDAARQLNYVPNSFARSLITRQSNIVAMLLGDLNNPFYTVALDEFSLRLQAVGKQVLVFNGASPNEVDDAVRRMLEYQVDGLILTAATTSMQVTSLCLEREIPVVMFNRYVPGFSGNSVCCDNFDGGRLAADTLFDAGATRFAVISGDINPAHLDTEYAATDLFHHVIAQGALKSFANYYVIGAMATPPFEIDSRPPITDLKSPTQAVVGTPP